MIEQVSIRKMRSLLLAAVGTKYSEVTDDLTGLLCRYLLRCSIAVRIGSTER